MPEQLRVNWLFPDQLNLYGDRGNLMALTRLGRLLGIDVVINRVSDPAASAPADLTVVGSGDLDTIATLAESRDALGEFLLNSKQIFVVGTSVALFVRTTTRWAHPDVTGLGLIAADARERQEDLANIMNPLGDDLYLVPAESPLGQTHLVGVSIVTLDVRLDADVQPFARVLYGLDNTATLGTSGFDGALLPNLVWTNLLGPAFVRNPWLGVWLIDRALGRTHVLDEELRDAWEWEFAAKGTFEAHVAPKIARS